MIDGVTVRVPAPVPEAGVTVSHDFASAGDYIVRLTVTDDRGQSASKSRTVTVTGSN